MRKIVITLVLTLATMAGSGLTARSALAANAALSTPGVTGVSAWGAAAGKGVLTGTSDAATVSGTQLWVNRYNSFANSNDDATSVAVSPSAGTVFVTGGSFVNVPTGDDYATIAYSG